MDQRTNVGGKRRVSMISQGSGKTSRETLDVPMSPVVKQFYLMPDQASSVPHSRSNSVKRKPQPKELSLILARQRTNSLPSTKPLNVALSFDDLSKGDCPLQRVRSFTKTSKGLINRGDSVKRKSNASLYAAAVAASDQMNNNNGNIPKTPSIGSASHSLVSSIDPTVFLVRVLGLSGVGKTSVTQQFMTSEYLGANHEIVNGDERVDMSVSVLVDGLESTLEFIDSNADMQSDSLTNVDGYVLVYSITNRKSFEHVVDVLFYLRQEKRIAKAIILTANKTDLVRKRQVSSEEGRSVAKQYDCKYVETSACINHNIDELLVGIVSQIRLKQNAEFNLSPIPKPEHKKRHSNTIWCMPKGARGILDILRRKKRCKSNKCDNLYE